MPLRNPEKEKKERKQLKLTNYGRSSPRCDSNGSGDHNSQHTTCDVFTLD
ncbi:hypothetical protein HanRHA438_Chr01g0005161 [Helianthus annuus]|nr:hypothetical protein HanRHA438_Chr01g0005161 [Helianthus annuus]